MLKINGVKLRTKNASKCVLGRTSSENSKELISKAVVKMVNERRKIKNLIDGGRLEIR